MWGDGGADVRNQMLSIEIKSLSRVYKQPCESLVPYCLCPLSSSALPPDAAGGSPPVTFLSWEPSGRSGCTLWGSEGGKKRWEHEADSYIERGVRAGKAIEPPKKKDSYLLHLFTAALYSLVRVDTGRDGGELLMVLTLSHLWVHAVDEALYSRHLEEETHRNTLLLIIIW